jgi:hypothetical protein
MNKTYKVAKGASFVGNKKTYKENDEIDENAFGGNKERFKHFLSCKKIVEVETSEKPKDEEPKEEKKPEQKPADKK